jgi:hypothetical protein
MTQSPALQTLWHVQIMQWQRKSASTGRSAASRAAGKRHVWMAPALQEISVIAMVCQYSRVSGLFA